MKDALQANWICIKHGRRRQCARWRPYAPHRLWRRRDPCPAFYDPLGKRAPLRAGHCTLIIAGGREEIRIPSHCVELKHLQVDLEVRCDERRDGGDGPVAVGSCGDWRTSAAARETAHAGSSSRSVKLAVFEAHAAEVHVPPPSVGLERLVEAEAANDTNCAQQGARDCERGDCLGVCSVCRVYKHMWCSRTAIGRLYAEKEHDHHLAQQLLPLGVRLARAGSPCGEALDPTSLKLRPVDPYARRGEAKCVCDNSIGGGDC